MSIDIVRVSAAPDRTSMTASDTALLELLSSHVKYRVCLFVSVIVAQHVKHQRLDMILGSGVLHSPATCIHCSLQM